MPNVADKWDFCEKKYEKISDKLSFKFFDIHYSL